MGWVALWPVFICLACCSGSVDRSSSLLEPPAAIKPLLQGDWSIANRAPTVELYCLPLDPIKDSTPPEGETPRQWTAWGQGTIDPETGRFYGAVGDHAGRDARIHIVTFDPRTKEISLSPEINAALGARPGAFADGKIHGRLDFYNGQGPWLARPLRFANEDFKARGNFSSTRPWFQATGEGRVEGSSLDAGPWLWFCTYWAKYPEPSAEDYATGYKGGHIGRYNVLTGDVADEGVPLPHASWPSHLVDVARGRLYAAGHFGEFLAWDIGAKKALFAGRLPEGMSWGNRVLLLDEKTGFVYSSNTDGNDTSFNMIRFDPAGNRFEKLPLPMPPDEKGERGMIRANTARRGADGLFRAVTQNGVLFAFDPEKATIAPIGICWPGERRYTTSIAISPDGRYLYYLPGAHGDSFSEGSPLVRYDTQLKRFKVLAFLSSELLSKYGYLVGGTYSVVLDPSGETLYILMNGAFRDPKDAGLLPKQAFGAPVLLILTGVRS